MLNATLVCIACFAARFEAGPRARLRHRVVHSIIIPCANSPFAPIPTIPG